MSTNELKHFGVKGMQWGVRRYQNYGGSYTKAGLERYNKARDDYDKKKENYKQTKAAKKQGLADSYEVRKAKVDLKGSERELKKHYKHLKLDKLADEGKLEYASGKRIRSNEDIRNLVHTGGILATAVLSKKGDYTKAAYALAGTAALDVATRILEEHSNRRLRAFYGHTSNY